MKRVIIESPYAGDIQANVAYAREALRHSLALGEAPIASHLLYTQVLDDDIATERQLGIDAGLAWHPFAEASVLYCDLGLSPGMLYGMRAAEEVGVPIIARWLRTAPQPITQLCSCATVEDYHTTYNIGCLYTGRPFKLSQQAQHLIQLSDTPQKILANAYGVSKRTICRIRSGYTVKPLKLTEAQRAVIQHSNEPPTTLARRFGVSRKTIWRLRHHD